MNKEFWKNRNECVKLLIKIQRTTKNKNKTRKYSEREKKNPLRERVKK
jgi:hypothetical protein